MCLVDDDILYLPLPPHAEPLCLGFSVDFAGDVEMLHNDTIDIHRHRIADDSRSDLPRVVRIDARYFTHMAVPTAVAILPLASACAAKLRIHPVFFTREVYELPGEDSSVGTHNAAHGICIDAEVNSKDGLLLNRLLLKEDYLFIGEAEGIAMIPFHQSGSGSIGTGPVLADEIGIVQATKDSREGFKANYRDAVLYCDGQSAELGELAWQMFQNSVNRPKMPVNTFVFPESLSFVKAKPELAGECVMGIFKIQHDLDKKHPARYFVFIEEEKTPEFDMLKAAGIPYFYCVAPLNFDEDSTMAFYDYESTRSRFAARRMANIKERPQEIEDPCLA